MKIKLKNQKKFICALLQGAFLLGVSFCNASVAEDSLQSELGSNGSSRL